jgi:hypothetical protein
MDRIEIVARAMARHHLGQQTFASALNPELIAKVCRGAEDKLWPSLVEEAKAVVQALDDAAAPKAVESSHEAALEPARQAAVQSEKAAAVETPGGERGDRVSSSGEKKAETNMMILILWRVCQLRGTSNRKRQRRPRAVAGTGPSTGFDRPWRRSAFRPGLARQCISQLGAPHRSGGNRSPNGAARPAFIAMDS